MQSLPLVPYRSILSFGNPSIDPENPGYHQHFYWIDNQQYLLLTTEKAFKIISLPEFKTKFMGPTFKDKICGISCYNENVFIAFEKRILKLHLFHILDQIKFPESETVQSLKIFGKILLVGMKDSLKVYDSANLRLINEINLGFPASLMEHPLTYKNKVLLSDGTHVVLVNVNSAKKLFSYNDDQDMHVILSKVIP